MFGLIIIGDEILNGSYTDAHFAFVKQALLQRGLRLAWVRYIADVREEIVQELKNSFAANIPVFVTGGIGATPDDHTRQAAAAALGVELTLHPQAAHIINTVVAQRLETADLNSAIHQQRLEMAQFPQGSEMIPNPFNQIAGFSILQHYFFPGFPVMAHPMMEWVLETHYAHAFFKAQHAQDSWLVYGLQESQITPLMHAIEAQFEGVQTFSLPKVSAPDAPRRYIIELGVKASGAACVQLSEAAQTLRQQVLALGGEIETIAAD